MERHLHTWDTIENYRSVFGHTELLTNRSNEGWEMVSVVMINNTTMRIYWKKKANPLPDLPEIR